jgi:DNA-binding PadR family transcriptional regulator
MYGEITMTTLDVIWRQPEKAYGAMITKAVSSRVGRDLSDAQVYVTLGRLEASGFLKALLTENSMPSVNSKGRPRKMYTLTAKGVRALDEVRSANPLGIALEHSLARSCGDEEIAKKGTWSTV